MVTPWAQIGARARARYQTLAREYRWWCRQNRRCLVSGVDLERGGRRYRNSQVETTIKCLRTKLLRLQKFLLRPGPQPRLRVRDRATCAQVTLSSTSRDIAGFRVGRHAAGNHQLYRRYPSNGSRRYYHCRVRGGSLVVGPAQVCLQGAHLALMYSQHHRTRGSTQGQVDHSLRIRPVTPPGSFVFYQSERLSTDVLRQPLYLRLGGEIELTFSTTKTGQYYKILPGKDGSLSQVLRGFTWQGRPLSARDQNQISSWFPADWQRLVPVSESGAPSYK